MKFKIIFLVGPPASGKDTQGKLLAKKLKGKFLVTSNLLREFFEKNKRRYLKIGKKTFDLRKEKEKIEKGILVSSEIVIKVVLDKIREFIKNKEILILAGSPRTLKEAKVEFSFLKNNLPGQFIIIFLNVSQKEIIKRALERKREDDKLEIIKRRIELFKKDTLPAINFLKKNNCLIKINGEGSVKEIHKRIISTLQLTTYYRNSQLTTIYAD